MVYVLTDMQANVFEERSLIQQDIFQIIFIILIKLCYLWT